jgi:hypothetical protein
MGQTDSVDIRFEEAMTFAALETASEHVSKARIRAKRVGRFDLLERIRRAAEELADVRSTLGAERGVYVAP